MDTLGEMRIKSRLRTRRGSTHRPGHLAARHLTPFETTVDPPEVAKAVGCPY